MPPLLAALPLIAAIGGLAGTGVGLGLELSNQPSGKPSAAPTETPTAITNTQNQEKALISQNAPNVLAETSGLVNPDYVAQISQLLAGTGGNPGSTGAAREIAQQIFGLPSLPGAGSGSAPSFTPASASKNPNPASPETDTKLSEFLNQFF